MRSFLQPPLIEVIKSSCLASAQETLATAHVLNEGKFSVWQAMLAIQSLIFISVQSGHFSFVPFLI